MIPRGDDHRNRQRYARTLTQRPVNSNSNPNSNPNSNINPDPNRNFDSNATYNPRYKRTETKVDELTREIPRTETKIGELKGDIPSTEVKLEEQTREVPRESSEGNDMSFQVELNAESEFLPCQEDPVESPDLTGSRLITLQRQAQVLQDEQDDFSLAAGNRESIQDTVPLESQEGFEITNTDDQLEDLDPYEDVPMERRKMESGMSEPGVEEILADYEYQVKSLQTELQDIHENHKFLIEEDKEKSREIEILKGALHRSETHNGAMENEILTLTSAIGDKERALSNQQHEGERAMDHIQTQRQQHEAQVHSLKQMIESLNANLQQASDRVGFYEEKRARGDEEKRALTMRIEEAGRQMRDLEDQLHRERQQNRELQQKTTDAINRSRELEVEIDRCQKHSKSVRDRGESHSNSLRMEIDKGIKLLAAEAEVKKKLLEENRNMESHIQKMHAKLSEYDQRARDDASAIREKGEEVNKLRSELGLRAQLLHKQTQALSDVSKQYAQAQSIIRSLQSRIADLQSLEHHNLKPSRQQQQFSDPFSARGKALTSFSTHPAGAVEREDRLDVYNYPLDNAQTLSGTVSRPQNPYYAPAQERDWGSTGVIGRQEPSGVRRAWEDRANPTPIPGGQVNVKCRGNAEKERYEDSRTRGRRTNYGSHGAMTSPHGFHDRNPITPEPRHPRNPGETSRNPGNTFRNPGNTSRNPGIMARNPEPEVRSPGVDRRDPRGKLHPGSFTAGVTRQKPQSETKTKNFTVEDSVQMEKRLMELSVEKDRLTSKQAKLSRRTSRRRADIMEKRETDNRLEEVISEINKLKLGLRRMRVI